jgi:phage tail-like protein
VALPEMDTSVGHSFGLEIDGVVIKQIQEVSGIKLEQDVIELKQNTPDGKFQIKKLPGRQKAGEITLTRGLTADNSFEK